MMPKRFPQFLIIVGLGFGLALFASLFSHLPI
jgi:hypothetical protein